jgi:hypothetical protein
LLLEVVGHFRTKSKFRWRTKLISSLQYVLWVVYAGLAAMLMSNPALAGGGMVLRDGLCIIQIGFYDTHFTAYQPQTRGNEQFCQELPDVGETLFVLDYLHNSMKEVPVDFRIIKDVTRLGKFVQVSDIEAIEDINSVTVFYHEPTVHSDATLSVGHTFSAPGDYIGIVTAGHPIKDTIYSAVFPFSVGTTDDTRLLLWGFLVLMLLPLGYYLSRHHRGTTEK